MSYATFIAGKLQLRESAGLDGAELVEDWLFPYQRDLVAWALRRGRAAIFADTGLGKTRMQLRWAQEVASRVGPVLILAPLSVAAQTAREGAAIGIPVAICRDGSEVKPGITITNYERLHRFDASLFSGVVLDESSCIKHHDAKALRTLIEAFGNTPYRLCATATPAPNDYTELGTHAEFLGVCSRSEMLAEYFCHDGGETQKWRVKGHAREAFWRFVASWGAMLRAPSDLGYSDAGFALPPLTLHEHQTETSREEVHAAGFLFAEEASDLMERRGARRASIGARVRECAALVNADSTTPWVVWCDLNAESEALTEAIIGAVEVRGSMDIDAKEAALDAFTQGGHRVIVTKPSIAGFGLNWQHCNRMAFVGVTDSWEAYYQAVRRCWRFGQKNPVDVHIFASDREGAVVRNLERKGIQAMAMAAELSAETREAVMESVGGSRRVSNPYKSAKRMQIPQWLEEGP